MLEQRAAYWVCVCVCVDVHTHTHYVHEARGAEGGWSKVWIHTAQLRLWKRQKNIFCCHHVRGHVCVCLCVILFLELGSVWREKGVMQLTNCINTHIHTQHTVSHAHTRWQLAACTISPPPSLCLSVTHTHTQLAWGQTDESCYAVSAHKLQINWAKIHITV